MNGTPYRYTCPYGLRDGIIPVPDGVTEVRGFRVVGGLEYTAYEPCSCGSCGHQWRVVCETTWDGKKPACPSCGSMKGRCE